MSIDTASALADLADQVAAAADLDADARRDVAFDIEVGDPEFAIMAAVLATRRPLPAPLLAQVRAGVNAGWYSSSALRADMLAALDRLDLQAR